MSFINNDTIVAVATAPLAAGVAVIRISGKKSKIIVDKLCPSFKDKKPRFMHYGKLFSSKGELLDETLMVYFKAPNSFTGEDIVEINCHGGMAVIDGILNELLKEDNIRHAQAGEFTRRAFINNKMDLTAAEGIADLVEAETEEQKKQALSQMKGELGESFENWRQQIINLLAHSEASIDFPDEELDILADVGLKEKLGNIINELEISIKNNVGCRLREGFKVVIIGKPNAGKSSLTNLLTGKETAIVSNIEGTTRDIIDSRINIAGYPVILSDTAGIRESNDIIEKEGVNRAKNKIKEADIIILVVDGESLPEIDKDLSSMLVENKSLVVISKKDKLNHKVDYVSDILLNHKVELLKKEFPALISNLTSKDSLNDIINNLENIISKLFTKTQGAARISRERHREAVHITLEHLKRAYQLFDNNNSTFSLSELLAQDLRDAAYSIGTITGKTDTEDVLDLVFSTFCIGK